MKISAKLLSCLSFDELENSSADSQVICHFVSVVTNTGHKGKEPKSCCKFSHYNLAPYLWMRLISMANLHKILANFRLLEMSFGVLSMMVDDGC